MTKQSDEDEFLAAMQDVMPVAKGRKQKVVPGTQDAQVIRQRRDNALGVGQESVDPNFLTLGEGETLPASRKFRMA